MSPKVFLLSLGSPWGSLLPIHLPQTPKSWGFGLAPPCLGQMGSNEIIFHLVPKPAYPHTSPTLLLSVPCFEQQTGKIIEHEFTWLPYFWQHDFKQMNSRETVSDGMNIPGWWYSHDFSSWTALFKGEAQVNRVRVLKTGPVGFAKMICKWQAFKKVSCYHTLAIL
jgi:hypothetical protein